MRLDNGSHPAVPSVITAAATRDEARELAIDALM